MVFGNGCLADEIVLALNKMRFKVRKGDPHGFRVWERYKNHIENVMFCALQTLGSKKNTDYSTYNC